MKLTKSAIDALVCPPGRRDLFVFDDEVPGFGVRVTPRRKTFVLQYQIGGRGGRRTRLVLGRYGEITPHQARRLAEDARAKIRLGIDPAADRIATAAAARQAALPVFTLATLIDRWAEIGLRTKSSAHRAEATRALRVTFAAVLDQAAEALAPAVVQQLIDELVTRRPVMARRIRDYGRAAFNWAQSRNLARGNPFATVRVEAREVSRERVLTEIEVREAWRAAGALAPPIGPFLRFLLLTLQRRGEVAAMEWGELDADLRVWEIPGARTKNGKPHIVPLAPQARALLTALPRWRGTALVFPTHARTGAHDGRAWCPMSGFSAAAERLHGHILAGRLAEALLSAGGPERYPPLDWRWHDFRRTGVTILARLQVPPHVADRLLNHVQGTITVVAAVYQRHDFLAERADALCRWADFVTGEGRSGSSPGSSSSLAR